MEQPLCFWDEQCKQFFCHDLHICKQSTKNNNDRLFQELQEKRTKEASLPSSSQIICLHLETCRSWHRAVVALIFMSSISVLMIVRSVCSRRQVLNGLWNSFSNLDSFWRFPLFWVLSQLLYTVLQYICSFSVDLESHNGHGTGLTFTGVCCTKTDEGGAVQFFSCLSLEAFWTRTYYMAYFCHTWRELT